MGVDGLIVQVEHSFAHPLPAVWGLLTDLERMAGLGPEHRSTRLVDGPVRLGARFLGHNERPGLSWEVPCEVTVYDPPTGFGWVVGNVAAPTATWTYELRGDGPHTVVTQTFRHGPGWSYLRRAIERRPDREAQYVAERRAELAANMQAVLRAAEGLLQTRRPGEPTGA